MPNAPMDRLNSDSTAAIQQQDNHFIHPWDDMNEVDQFNRTVISRGEGVYVYDSDGNKLIDAPAGMWCVNIGHGRQEMADAISAQVMTLSYNSPWSLTNSPAAKLADKLAELTPGDLNHVFFTTGGSTAVDSALRFIGFRNNLLGKPEKKHFITRENGYHGSTFLSSSCSGKSNDKKYLDMLSDNFHMLSDPNPIKRPEGMSVEGYCDHLIAELEQTIARIGADKIAAFVGEPILASGGVVVPPEGYFKRCADVCRANDILFVADEVVTAFGRLGHFFASEAVFGVVPDIITSAKGITSGYVPLGAMFVSDKLLAELKGIDDDYAPFSNGFTYSGHPVACAAALKNIEIIENEQLLEHVQSLAPYFQEQLQTLSDIAIVTDVRGHGLMGCVECDNDAVSTKDDLAIGDRIDAYCQELGLIVRPIYNMCVMSPPLTITKTQIDDIIRILREGLEKAAADVLV